MFTQSSIYSCSRTWPHMRRSCVDFVHVNLPHGNHWWWCIGIIRCAAFLISIVKIAYRTAIVCSVSKTETSSVSTGYFAKGRWNVSCLKNSETYQSNLGPILCFTFYTFTIFRKLISGIPIPLSTPFRLQKGTCNGSDFSPPTLWLFDGRTRRQARKHLLHTER